MWKQMLKHLTVYLSHSVLGQQTPCLFLCMSFSTPRGAIRKAALIV